MARLLDTADHHAGVPAETRQCLDQLSATVQDLLRRCESNAITGGTCEETPRARLHRYDSRRLQDALVGDILGETPSRLRCDTTLADSGLDHLTAQERRILGLLAEGFTNRQIAAQLFLAEKTVKNYVSNLLRKLGMERRTQAAVYAIRLDRTVDLTAGPRCPA